MASSLCGRVGSSTFANIIRHCLQLLLQESASYHWSIILLGAHLSLILWQFFGEKKLCAPSLSHLLHLPGLPIPANKNLRSCDWFEYPLFIKDNSRIMLVRQDRTFGLFNPHKPFTTIKEIIQVAVGRIVQPTAAEINDQCWSCSFNMENSSAASLVEETPGDEQRYWWIPANFSWSLSTCPGQHTKPFLRKVCGRMIHRKLQARSITTPRPAGRI